MLTTEVSSVESGGCQFPSQILIGDPSRPGLVPGYPTPGLNTETTCDHDQTRVDDLRRSRRLFSKSLRVVRSLRSETGPVVSRVDRRDCPGETSRPCYRR